MVNLALKSHQMGQGDGQAIRPDQWSSIEDLMDAATRGTGLHDFGKGDFRVGLSQLLASLRQDVPMDQSAARVVEGLLIGRLENRLRVEEWHRQNPGAADTVIDAPISITGLPRTGTTALANMMSLDPQFRPLRAWEQASPYPPPVLETEAEDPRRLKMLEGLKAMMGDRPEQAAMHLYDIDTTEEDHDALGLGFTAQHSTLPVNSYRVWWRSADLSDAYAYHRRVLQLLQSRRPPNKWLLKAPHHKCHLESIVSAYPDVRFIFTHRDPVKVVPSFISFTTSMYPQHVVDALGIENIARNLYVHELESLRIAMAARDRLGEDRFVDVHQSRLNADAIGTLEWLYGALDLPFTGTFVDTVKAWHEHNASGAHGEHRYTLEQYGLSAEEVRSDYAFYVDRFNLV